MLDQGQKAQIVQSISDLRIQQILYGYFQNRLEGHIEDIRQSATLTVLEQEYSEIDDVRRSFILACIGEGGREMVHIREVVHLAQNRIRRTYVRIDCKAFPDVFLNYLTALQRKIIRFRRNNMSYADIANNTRVRGLYVGKLLRSIRKKYTKWVASQRSDWRDALPPQHARLYEMRYLQGLTNGAIAEKLGILKNCVAQRFFVIHSILRKRDVQITD